MGKEFSIEVSMVPHPWDNPDDPYFWCVFEMAAMPDLGGVKPQRQRGKWRWNITRGLRKSLNRKPV